MHIKGYMHELYYDQDNINLQDKNLSKSVHIILVILKEEWTPKNHCSRMVGPLILLIEKDAN